MKTPTLESIGERLRTQDNRCTKNPMFCVQIQRADTGYDSAYGDDFCWYHPDSGDVVYDEAPEDWEEYGESNGWEKFGYKLRWETVMVAFTQGGCEEYLELDGHNCRSRAHKGQVRIYAESFTRCPEMIHIRETLMSMSATGGTPEP